MPKVGMQPIRRQQLIEATLTAVDQVGMADASIALIARLAGVSNGIISHYFRGQERSDRRHHAVPDERA
jgi:TetR/AcrR family transcriptional regulator, transcriptional repressor of bet genes